MRIFIFVLLCISGISLHSQQALPLDTSTSSITFSVNSFGWVEVQGSFQPVEGQLVISDSTLFDSVSFRVAATSLQSGWKWRDLSVQNEEYLNVEEHPYIQFTSTSLLRTETGMDIQGILEINGVKHNVLIATEIQANESGYRMEAFYELDRYDYAVGDKSGVIVGREVHLNLKLNFGR